MDFRKIFKIAAKVSISAINLNVSTAKYIEKTNDKSIIFSNYIEQRVQDKYFLNSSEDAKI